MFIKNNGMHENIVWPSSIRLPKTKVYSEEQDKRKPLYQPQDKQHNEPKHTCIHNPILQPFHELLNFENKSTCKHAIQSMSTKIKPQERVGYWEIIFLFFSGKNLCSYSPFYRIEIWCTFETSQLATMQQCNPVTSFLQWAPTSNPRRG